MPHYSLTGSVGKLGANKPNDTRIIQTLLKQHKIDCGVIDGLCGKKTITAITLFQKGFLSWPDGRIDVGGMSWRKLSSIPQKIVKGGTPHIATAAPHVVSPAPSVIANVWTGNARKWSKQKKLASLNPSFRIHVKAVLDELKKQGYKPMLYCGWRSVADQLETFKRGDSKVLFGFHNAQLKNGTPNSYAVDIIKYNSDPHTISQFRKALGKIAKNRGLVWGGDWSFYDPAHIQGKRNSELRAVKKESGL